MALDYNNILTEFVRVASEGVGSQLSTKGSPPHPSVIRARTGEPQPDHPYVQLDILSTSKTSGWLLDEGVTETDETYRDTHYKLLLQYTVYGGNANSIAHELEAYFRSDRVLGEVENNTSGTVEQTFEVISSPEGLATENLEVAAFNLTFNINDRMVDSAQGVFDTINIDAEVKRNVDDPDPLLFSVAESST